MSKKPAKPAAASDTSAADAPKKKSKLKLALLVLAPLVLAGGGYAGWTMFLAAPGGEEAHASESGEDHGADEIKVSAVPAEIAAETSFTHSFALSVLLAQRCGVVDAAALKAASDEEAIADGALVSLSWQAAARRVATLTEKSCGHMMAEIVGADAKATRLAAEKLAPEKGGKAAAHH